MSLSKILKRKNKKPKENSKVLRYYCRNGNEIYHLKNKPENATIIGRMRFAKLGYIITIIDFKNNYEKINFSVFNKIPHSILKSNLQKAIRLGKYNVALNTSLYMIKVCPVDFFRRLTIIYIEDVWFDKHFDHLMWLMCAVSKKYILSINDLNWCLGLVKHLCIKEQLWEYQNPSINFDFVRSKVLNGKIDTRLLSLAYRYEFNGMNGELKLILNYIEKYNFENYYHVDDIILIDFTKIRIFHPKNIILTAIDFHCSNIINYLLEKYKPSDWNAEILKSVIWNYRSSINWRTKNKKESSFYKCIKRDCDTYAELIINQFI